ncbi:MAG TPA: hypothetical protein VLB85_09140 [Acidimicrobiia bacterium]|nr:hypothetical protein [Acidimicrobiia bacterium]
MRKKITLLLAVIAIFGAVTPAGAEPWRIVEDDLHYGVFYAGFDVAVAVFEEASVAHAFEPDLGPALLRVFESNDRSIGVRSGSVDADLKADVAPEFRYRVPDRDSSLRWHAPYVD